MIVKILNPEALNKLGVYLIMPVSESLNTISYRISPLPEIEDSFEALFEEGLSSTQIEAIMDETKSKPKAACLIDSLAEQTAEKLLKLPQSIWPDIMLKHIKRFSSLKGFDKDYFTSKVTALIH
jgi:hypothetical protein